MLNEMKQSTLIKKNTTKVPHNDSESIENEVIEYGNITITITIKTMKYITFEVTINTNEIE